MCAPLKYKVEGILDDNGAKLPLKKENFKLKIIKMKNIFHFCDPYRKMSIF